MNFIKILVSLSISGTLLAIIIFLLKGIYKNRFSKCFQYYIWLLAVLRFLLPFSPDTTIVGNLFKSVEAPFSNSSAYELSTGGSDYVQKTGKEEDVNATEIVESMETQLKWDDDTAVSDRAVNFYTCAFIVWLFIAVGKLIRKITLYRSFASYIKATNTEVSDTEAINLLAACGEETHVNKPVELYYNPLITSPVTLGFFRPCIVLPEGHIAKEKLYYVFMHELYHIKRHDMFYKWLVQIVSCVHWFNPFIRLMKKEIEKACELSCDEAVICSLDDDAKREYGNTLLFFLKTNAEADSASLLMLSEEADRIKERLGAIMNFKRKSKRIFITSLVVVAVVFIASIGLGAYRTQDVNSDISDSNTHITALQNENADNGDTDKDNGKAAVQMAVQDSDGTIILSTGNKMIEEDGIYYIFCDDADESDKPIGGVTEGCLGFTLVYKDRYCSLGTFENLETLVEEVTEACKEDNEYFRLTKAEQELLIEAAGIVAVLPKRDTDNYW